VENAWGKETQEPEESEEEEEGEEGNRNGPTDKRKILRCPKFNYEGQRVEAGRDQGSQFINSYRQSNKKTVYVKTMTFSTTANHPGHYPLFSNELLGLLTPTNPEAR
jgi:hypothetical protein